MCDQQTKHQFVELRAQGWTLARLATHLHVSKRTLVEWNRMFQSEIMDLRAVETEALESELLASQAEELARLAKHQKAIQAELSARDLKCISTENLFRLGALVSRQIQQVRLQPALYGEPSAHPIAGPTANPLPSQAIGPNVTSAAAYDSQSLSPATQHPGPVRPDVESFAMPPKETPLRCNFCPFGPPTLGTSFKKCCRNK